MSKKKAKNLKPVLGLISAVGAFSLEFTNRILGT